MFSHSFPRFALTLCTLKEAGPAKSLTQWKRQSLPSPDLSAKPSKTHPKHHKCLFSVAVFACCQAKAGGPSPTEPTQHSPTLQEGWTSSSTQSIETPTAATTGQ